LNLQIIEQLSTCRLILLFGGTFDPPHRAHVELPQRARKAVEADMVAYIPAAVSPFKQDQAVTAATHRLEMLRLALCDQPAAVILTDELDRAASGEPSYTVDTVQRLRDQVGPGPTFRLLIGADQMARFDRWRNYEEIIKQAEPLVMARPPQTRDSVLQKLPTGFDPDRWRERILDLPEIEVSSTELRRRLPQRPETADEIPPAVLEYIRRHGLYGSTHAGDAASA